MDLNPASDERKYLYLGIFFVGFFIFIGLALVSEKQTFSKNDASVTLALKTKQNAYQAEVHEEKLFLEGTTVLFSPVENNQGGQPIQCTIKCIN